jgi:hypothetical protein
MKEIKWEGCNGAIGYPPQRPLPVFMAPGSSNTVSAWKPSPEELKALNAGACVMLTCFGYQPPVALMVQKVKEATLQ